MVEKGMFQRIHILVLAMGGRETSRVTHITQRKTDQHHYNVGELTDQPHNGITASEL